ncbi:hypothetical protein ElyMa_000041300 [Elysia marginata]|uniref:Uncharacterized protein n=1 Tax=Elysia marginata TaxID=1093978 RepID=A0AAV4EDD0_9GAST|nr:hypothetical protein ElyMa_000041300 [Elysia marginata]
MLLRSKVYRPKFDTTRDRISAAYAIFTSYAFKMIEQELDKLNKQVVPYNTETKTMAVSRGDGEEIIYPVDEGCTCLHFVKSSCLAGTCWGFSKQRISLLWTNCLSDIVRIKMVECVLSEIENGVVQTEEPCVTWQVLVVGRKKEKSEWEKRITMKETCRELVAVGVRCGQREFDKRMGLLQKLISTGVVGEVG